MDEISRTLDVYERNADTFADKYRTESIAARSGDDFLTALSGNRVLDVGCGPGADTATFSTNGYEVTGFDLTSSFLQEARDAIPGTPFVRGDMRQLPFHQGVFDGIWSCASFLHVPRTDAPEVLREFKRVLTDDGVVFLSVKCGEKSGYDVDGRYFERYLPGEIQSLLGDIGFKPLCVREGDGWVAVVAIES